MRLIALLLLCCATQLPGQNAKVRGANFAAPRPNFVFMLSDDQNWAGLSVAMLPGEAKSKSAFVETPSLERLAAAGMVFSAAYAPSPVCSPTRASLQTGRNPATLRWTKAAPNLDPTDGYRLIEPQSERSLSQEETTMAEMLKMAGYATAHYGKWHLEGRGPEKHGYDDSDGNTSNRDAEPFVPPNPVDIFGMGDRAVQFMEKAKGQNKPFYIQLSYHALHYPQNAFPETIQKYRQKMAKGKEKAIFGAAIAENLDTGVGKLLDAIKDLGLAEDTYVIYMSDNGGGGAGRDRLLQGGKGGLWEGGIRVPFIIRGPGIRAGTYCHVPIIGQDLFPTLCELAGVTDMPDGLEGGSFAACLSSPNSNITRPRKELVWHFPHYQGKDGPHSAIRRDDHKLIKFYETGETKLFNLANDLGETEDLSAKQPEFTGKLAQRLVDYLREAGAEFPTPNPHYDPNVAPKPIKPPAQSRPPKRRKQSQKL